MPRVRPTERDAIARLLDEPAESVTALATNVILTIDRLRAQRDDWFILVQDPGVSLHLHGPFITRNAAQKAIDNSEVFASSPGARGVVMQLTKPTEKEEDDGV